MDPYRKNKKSQSILVVLSDLIQTAVKDPRVGMVSINRVELNRDQSVAIVSFSVMGGDEERALTFKGLKKARGYLQSRVGRTLGLRQVPEFRFVYDESIARGIELDTVLDNMAQITHKINTGDGTLGALVNERVLYDGAEEVMAGVNDSKFVDPVTEFWE